MGCPAWGNSEAITLSFSLPTSITTAETLFLYNLTNGTQVIGATVNTVGAAGKVVVLLAPDATGGSAAGTGYGTTRHLLQRMRNDTLPVVISSNVSSDNANGGGEGGVEMQLNRTPWGWIALVINNNGVTKDPSVPPTIDATEGRALAVTLLPSAGEPVSAWVQDGGSPRQALVLESGGTVSVQVEAGGLRLCP